MINMSPSERVEFAKNSTIEYSTKFEDDLCYLSPTLCGVKFCGWFINTIECNEALSLFLSTWDGVDLPSTLY